MPGVSAAIHPFHKQLHRELSHEQSRLVDRGQRDVMQWGKERVVIPDDRSAACE
jgi:hypothetical protein